ncbi:putative cyclin-D6-1 [Mercurialis annua]|uniref:putative cyclin-D6-1 n=1 Tax=Mercurialis annua TaxID=3986 RepID=UPI0021601DA8|nr:putative cyclin-D6-1 [Mercurialis annua]
MKNNAPLPLQFLAQQELEKCLNDDTPAMPIEAFNNPTLHNLSKIGVSVISESLKNQNYDASVPYHAINLFCRFISRRKFPDITPDQKVDSTDITKFENLIFEVLDQSSDSVTALSFVANFLSIVSESDLILKLKVIKLIVHSGEEISFMQFKPSVIAASAILVTCPTSNLSQYREKFTAVRMDPNDLDACVHLMDEFRKKMAIAIDNDKDKLTGDYGSSSSLGTAEVNLMDFDVKWMSDPNLTMDPSLFLDEEEEGEAESVDTIQDEAEDDKHELVAPIEESVASFLRFCYRG